MTQKNLSIGGIGGKDLQEKLQVQAGIAGGYKGSQMYKRGKVATRVPLGKIQVLAVIAALGEYRSRE